MCKTQQAMAELAEGLIFVNLVDFDQQYGHRNDIEGYGAALEEFDAWLPQFIAAWGEGDLAVFTADHGCDPSIPGTDHTREYVPLLAAGPRLKSGTDLGLRASLSDIGQTVAENFAATISNGTSFLSQLL
jgi:phosphopentomutase